MAEPEPADHEENYQDKRNERESGSEIEDPKRNASPGDIISILISKW